MRSLRRVLRSPSRHRGTVQLNLVLVVAFVLVAVFELARTWFSAMDISGDLAVVDDQGAGIAAHTGEIERLYRTSTLTGDIQARTEPLEQQATEVSRTTGSIDERAGAIASTARAIDAGVRGVTASVGTINDTAAALLSTVRGIEASAGAIGANAAGINQHFAALLPVTQRILDGPEPLGVDNIDRNTDEVIATSLPLRQDLRDILTIVRQVDQHARSICEALPVDLDLANVLPVPTTGNGC